jgi:hypothetical protein
MSNKEKREFRKLKKEIKRRGNKRLRSALKRDLEENPEITHLINPEIEKYVSQELNGKFLDPNRKKKKPK